MSIRRLTAVSWLFVTVCMYFGVLIANISQYPVMEGTIPVAIEAPPGFNYITAMVFSFYFLTKDSGQGNILSAWISKVKGTGNADPSVK
jgi:hypothetical protein